MRFPFRERSCVLLQSFDVHAMARLQSRFSNGVVSIVDVVSQQTQSASHRTLDSRVPKPARPQFFLDPHGNRAIRLRRRNCLRSGVLHLLHKGTTTGSFWLRTIIRHGSVCLWWDTRQLMGTFGDRGWATRYSDVPPLPIMLNSAMDNCRPAGHR